MYLVLRESSAPLAVRSDGERVLRMLRFHFRISRRWLAGRIGHAVPLGMLTGGFGSGIPAAGPFLHRRSIGKSPLTEVSRVSHRVSLEKPSFGARQSLKKRPTYVGSKTEGQDSKETKAI
jgi:hypothetical protein